MTGGMSRQAVDVVGSRENMCRRRARRGRGERLAAEPLEPRRLLASHPGFVYDAAGALVAVDADVQAALGDILAAISADYEGRPDPGSDYSPPADLPGRELLIWEDGDGIVVTALATAGEAATLRGEILGLGGTRIVSWGDHVSARVPFAALDELAAAASLRHADAAREPVSNSGLVNQAGLALEADLAGAWFGVDGSGVRIGVISDSFNHLGGYAFDVASGVLPAGIAVLKENPITVEDGQLQPDSDEGRAMAQLVHAIAPGAEIAFATAGHTPADFADSIEQLVAAGCEIIVDDITEAGVPWFQDGIVAQAVNAAVRDAGVTYLTSAGNFGRNSYAAEFRGVAAADIADLPAELDSPGLVLHDFDSGPAVDVFQRVTIPAGTSSIRIDMQWDQPWGENASDVDLLIYAADGQTLLARLEGSHQTGADPLISDSLPIPADLGEVQLVVAHAGGEAPGYFKYLTYHADVGIEYGSGDSTIVGHANSATAAAVGAAFYFRTPAYRDVPGELAGSSSWGGTPLLRSETGQPLPAPEYRQQPRFVAPNLGDTSFFGSDVDLNGLPNFSGTSAAAPNAAAVAALLKQLDPGLTAEEIFAILAETAGGMPGAGGRQAVGAGLINAQDALARAAGIAISGTVFEDADQDGGRSAGELPLAEATVFLDLNGNGQLDRAPAPGAPFAYLGFESTEPTAIGIRTLIDNPNQPNDGPLERPFTATSEIEVSGLPGVVTDLGVLFSLRSDQVIEDELVGPLFVTLISPAGVRVPLRGTTVLGDGGDASPFTPVPLLLPADGQAYPQLVSQFETPVSEFLNGAGHAVLSQVDLAALVGSEPNGRWQLEVQSADASPARTATLESWELFLQTAELSVATDADGRYTLIGLPPANVVGPLTPRLLVPAGRSLLDPQTAYQFSLDVGQQAVDASFAVTAAAGVVDEVVDVAVGETASVVTPLGGDVRLVKRGAGPLVLDAASGHAGGTVVEAGELVIRDPAALGSGLLQVLSGGRVRLDLSTGKATVSSLAMAPAATLDLTTGSVLLAAGGYDLAAVEQLITAARGDGSWSGLGITSSSIEPGSSRAVGLRPLADGSLVVGYAAVGDATMDGRVNLFDLLTISASGVFDARGAAAGWWQGDFNADGVADGEDLLAMQATGLYGGGSYLPGGPAAMVGVATAGTMESAGTLASAATAPLSRVQALAWAMLAAEAEHDA